MRALILNASYEPIGITTWKRAMGLVYAKRVAEVLEEYPQEVHTTSMTFKLPAVVRLKHMVKRRWQVKFSRKAVLLRDRFICHYCGNHYPAQDLTMDHVIPSSRGGKTSWDNIITACKACNTRKGDRTPQEAKMPLLKRPKAPQRVPHMMAVMHMESAPQEWKNYLWST